MSDTESDKKTVDPAIPEGVTSTPGAGNIPVPPMTTSDAVDAKAGPDEAPNVEDICERTGKTIYELANEASDKFLGVIPRQGEERRPVQPSFWDKDAYKAWQPEPEEWDYKNDRPNRTP